MNEQNNGIVSLDGSYQPLRMIEAWVNSSCVIWFKAAFPIAELYVKVGSADGKEYQGTYQAFYHPFREMFRAYLPCACFTAHCETTYKVVSKDELGARSVLGEGKLRVRKGSIVEMNESNRTCFAYFTDGKWRKVTVGEDSYGAPTYIVSDETYDVVGVTTELYSYDNQKGEFYAVSGIIDDTGTPCLDVAQTPSQGGFECFTKDESTGFYRRIDAFEDSTGTESLETGKEII